MPVVRPVTLIAFVALTMGLDVIGGAHRGHVTPESCATTKAPVDPFVPPSPYPTKTQAGYFCFGANKLWTQIAQGRDLAGFAKVGRRHLPTEDILVQRGL
jgi:hypothetical protein